jgi:hypothetical protein
VVASPSDSNSIWVDSVTNEEADQWSARGAEEWLESPLGWIVCLLFIVAVQPWFLDGDDVELPCFAIPQEQVHQVI